MRGPQRWALAVRRPDGGISTEAHGLPWGPVDHPWIRKPFIRGVNVVAESLAIGMRALRISAAYSLSSETGGAGVDVSERQLGWAMGIAIAVFAAVFIAAPALVTKLGGHAIGVNSSLGQNLIEGGIRLGLFLGYITLISLIPDIRRVYQYHGAEHKTIAAYENGDPLEPEVVDRYPTLHVRCGTNFLFIVLFLTILVGLALDFLLPHVVLLRVAARILVIPLLAAFGYEIIRAASRDEHSLAFRVASLPGLALQKITTRAPDRDQIEVAIKAMEAVIAAEALAAGTVEPAP
ncbi:MAG: hypothetical protein QOD01_1940 [Actinomycetota bacterium]|nr:hypothetical protein [Actinomycetota bacterium]